MSEDSNELALGDKVEILLLVFLCIIAVIVVCIRLAFVFPKKANNPVFWGIASVSAILFGIIVYCIVRRLNL